MQPLRAFCAVCPFNAQVLCLHLKRFHWTAYLRNKVDTFVEFPLRSLDMKCYLLEVEHPWLGRGGSGQAQASGHSVSLASSPHLCSLKTAAQTVASMTLRQWLCTMGQGEYLERSGLGPRLLKTWRAVTHGGEVGKEKHQLLEWQGGWTGAPKALQGTRELVWLPCGLPSLPRVATSVGLLCEQVSINWKGSTSGSIDDWSAGGKSWRKGPPWMAGFVERPK